MAEGLRVLGRCPRCRGKLEFAGDGPADDIRAAEPADPAEPDTRPPHLVLGLPRRQ